MKKLLLVFMIVGIAHVSYAQTFEQKDVMARAQKIATLCSDPQKFTDENFTFCPQGGFVTVSCKDDKLYFWNKSENTLKEVEIISKLKQTFDASSLKIVGRVKLLPLGKEGNSAWKTLMKCQVMIVLQHVYTEKSLVSFVLDSKGQWQITNTEPVSAEILSQDNCDEEDAKDNIIYKKTEPFECKVTKCTANDMRRMFFYIIKDSQEKKINFPESEKISDISLIQNRLKAEELMVRIGYSNGKWQKFFIVHPDGKYDLAEF